MEQQLCEMTGDIPLINSFWSFFLVVLKTHRPSTDFDGEASKPQRLDAIRNFVKSISERESWEFRVDSVGNISIKTQSKDAIFCMQGHLDIVVSSDELHDFEKDGIDVIIERGWLRPVKKTTMGADNGGGHRLCSLNHGQIW